MVRLNPKQPTNRSYFNKKNTTSFASDTIWALYQDSYSNIWIGTEKGALRYSYTDNEFFLFQHSSTDHTTLSSNIVRSFTEDYDNDLWIATNYGLNKLSLTNYTITRHLHNPSDQKSMGGNSINTLHMTNDNVLWLGLFSKGLNKHIVDANRFQHVKHNPADPSSISSNNIWAINVYGKNVWLGTDGGGLNRYDIEKQLSTRYLHDPLNEHSIVDNRVWSLLQTSEEELWIGSYGKGLSKMNPLTGTFKHYPYDEFNDSSVIGESVVKIFQDRSKRIWVGTNNGLSRYDPISDSFMRYGVTHLPDFPQSYILNITEDTNGELWLSSYDEGVIRLNPNTGEYVEYKHNKDDPNSIANNKIMHILVDSRGLYWVSTYGNGISILDLNNNTTTHLTTRDGLANDSVYAVIEDQKGEYWISTNYGISQYNPLTKQFTNYGLSSGIQSTEFNSGAYFKDKSGRIFFGGVNGFNYFHPSQIKVDSVDLTVNLTELRVFNKVANIRNNSSYISDEYTLEKAIDDSDSITFGHRESLVSFEFSTLNFAYEKEIYFQYKLVGFDNDWITTDYNQRRATYTSLPAGRYKLLIRAKVQSGDWSTEEKAINVIVKPAPWFSAYAIAAYVFIIGFVVLAFINQRVQRFKRVKESEERLSLALWGSKNELWDWHLDKRILYKSGLAGQKFNKEVIENFDFQQLKLIIHPDDYQKVEEKYFTHIKSTSEHLEVRYRKKDEQGIWRWFRARVKAVSRDENNQATRIVGTVEDVNTLVEAEDNLKQLNEELEQRVIARTQELSNTLSELKATQAQLIESEKMASLVGLVSGVAHELNTPLGIVVSSFSQLEENIGQLIENLKSKSLTLKKLERFDSEAQALTELTNNSIKRAIRLVQNFKALSLSERSESLVKFAMNDLLDEVKTSHNDNLVKKHVSLDFEGDGDIVLCQFQNCLFEVLYQLIENSVIHAFDDVESPHINIQWKAEKGNLLLTYQDNGCGIAQSNREKVFEPFYTTKRGQGCTGLGMTIIYNQVKLVMHGTIYDEPTQRDTKQGMLISFAIPLDLHDLQ
jgi:ligand-binding sensor domain-containing protein/signal transduction histidine kinase